MTTTRVFSADGEAAADIFCTGVSDCVGAGDTMFIGTTSIIFFVDGQ